MSDVQEPVSMKDFAREEPLQSEAATVTNGAAYTDSEAAQTLAGLTSVSVDPRLADSYLATYTERTTPIFELCSTGDALEQLGVTKGSATQAPAVPRLIISLLYAVFEAWRSNKEFRTYAKQLPVHGRGGSPADTRNEENREVY